MKYHMALHLLWLPLYVVYLENVDMKLHLAAGGFWSQCGAMDMLKDLSKKQYL